MFCEKCGKELTTKNLINEGSIPYCEECDRYVFPKTSLAALVILSNSDNEVLLLKQKSVNDYYVLIAGYHKPGENMEETAIRETKEETNLDIVNIKYIESYYYEKKDSVMFVYHGVCDITRFELDITEVDDAKWFPIDEVTSKLRPGSIGERALKKFIG